MDLSKIFLNSDVLNGFKFGLSLCFAILIFDAGITLVIDLWCKYFKNFKKQDP